MKDLEKPHRFWIIWILIGLLLPLLAIFLRMRYQAPASSAGPSTGPTAKLVVVDDGPRNKNAALAEDEEEMADAVLEEILKEALSADSSGTESFLRTDYEPLSKWLDNRFEVEFTSVTPSQIFDVVPLNDIHYELKVDLAKTTKASFQASNISRRELLKRISEHWDLHMEIKYGDNGQPTAVRVTSR